MKKVLPTTTAKIIGANSRPWLNLDPIVDITSLRRIHQEIARGLTLAASFILAAGREWRRCDAAEALNAS